MIYPQLAFRSFGLNRKGNCLRQHKQGADNEKKIKILVAAVVAISVTAHAAVLGTYTWKGGNGNWSDATMWEGGVVPPPTDTRDANDYYEIKLRPMSGTHTVITLDQNIVYKNTHLKVLEVPDVVDATITLSGGKMEFRKASGPGVNNCSYAGANLRFVDCDIVLPGFNPLGGSITFGNGAKITSSASCYFSVANGAVTVEEGADVGFSSVDTRAGINGSKFVINGGKVSAGVLCTDNNYGEFLYQFNGGVFISTGGLVAHKDAVTTIEINGGKVRLPSINFNKSKSFLRISGGELLAPKPVDAENAQISFISGYYGVDSSSAGVFMTANDLCYLPQGEDAVLDLHRSGSGYANTWASMLTSNTESTDDYPDFRTNLVFSGTMQMTNDTLAALYTRGGDAIPRVGRRGKLFFPIVFSRAKGDADCKSTTEFDLELFALSRGIHAAVPTLTYDFLNGVTLGAFSRDWSSMGYFDANNAFQLQCCGPTMKFNGCVTVDTLDQLDRVTPRKIYLAKTAFNGVTNLTVKGGGSVWLCTTTASPRVGVVDIKENSTCEFAGSVKSGASNTNDIRSAELAADRIVMSAGATLRIPADRMAVSASEGEIDNGTTIEVNLSTTPAAGTIKKVIDLAAGENRAQTVLTGAASAGWSAKSLAGLVYLTDNTTAPVTGHDAEWYWTGETDCNMSEAGNWTTNAVPINGNGFKPRFTGSRNMEIVNDLSDWSCFNLYFTSSCGPVSLSGNPLTLRPGGYGGETAAIYSASPFPVVVNLDLARNGKFGVINVGTSHVQLNGEVVCGTQAATPADQYFVFKGSVQIGGSANAGAMLFFPHQSQGSTTKLTVLDGGVLTLEGGDATAAANESEQATVNTPVWICSGGSIKVAECFNTGKCPLAMRIDGTFDCAAIAQSATDITMMGSGEVLLGGACPSPKDSNIAKRVITAGGTLTLKMAGNWETISNEKANCPQVLNVNGDVRIVSASDWRYGHDASTVTTTSAADRAITIADGAKLTFAGSTQGTATLAELIVGPGTLDFESTANVIPGGDLASANCWTTIADVGEIVNLPTMLEYTYRVVDGGENGKLLQAKGKLGTIITIR